MKRRKRRRERDEERTKDPSEEGMWVEVGVEREFQMKTSLGQIYLRFLSLFTLVSQKVLKFLPRTEFFWVINFYTSFMYI